MSEARKLREYLLTRARRRGGRMLGRRPRWGPEHRQALVEQAKRSVRTQRPPEGRW